MMGEGRLVSIVQNKMIKQGFQLVNKDEQNQLVDLLSTWANCSWVTVQDLSPPLAYEIISFNSSSVMVSPSYCAILFKF